MLKTEHIQSNYPLVSIIIVNWNGGKVFDECLASLDRIEYPNWELMVVDNGSTDESEKLPQKYILSKRYKLIKNSNNIGFAQANNQAYAVSNADFLLLLNNDTKVTPNFLSLLINKMQKDSTIGILQPKIFLMDKIGYLDNAGSFFTSIGFLDHYGFDRKDSDEFNKEFEVFSVKGACMLIRKEVLKTVGFFDPDFVSYFEESDLCWRVWLAGYRVVYYPEAKIYHKLGFTIKRQNVWEINYHYYKNRICSLIKNLSYKRLFLVLSLHLFVSLGLIVVSLIKGNFKNSHMIIKALGWNVGNIQRTLKKRNKIQRSRKINDTELFQRVGCPVNLRKFFNDFKRVEKDIEACTK